MHQLLNMAQCGGKNTLRTSAHIPKFPANSYSRVGKYRGDLIVAASKGQSALPRSDPKTVLKENKTVTEEERGALPSQLLFVTAIPRKFRRLYLDCIDADFCDQIVQKLSGKRLTRCFGYLLEFARFQIPGVSSDLH